MAGGRSFRAPRSPWTIPTRRCTAADATPWWWSRPWPSSARSAWSRSPRSPTASRSRPSSPSPRSRSRSAPCWSAEAASTSASACCPPRRRRRW